LAFDASKSEKLGKEVEATPRQNVGKNFLAKRNQDRKIRDLAAAREKVRTPSDDGCAYGLTKRAVKIPSGEPKHKRKNAPSCGILRSATRNPSGGSKFPIWDAFSGLSRRFFAR
jgi:hypothetical protein